MVLLGKPLQYVLCWWRSRAFKKKATSKAQKPPSQLRFSLPFVIITITSNEPWNTESHKTDQNPPITNHKPWRFEPFELISCFLRGPLRWLASDSFFLTRGSNCTNHRKTILIACFLRDHLNVVNPMRDDLDFVWSEIFSMRQEETVWIKFGDAVSRNVSIYCWSMLSRLKLTNAHTVSGRPTLKNDSGRLKEAKLRTFARKQILRKPIKKLVKKMTEM